MMQTAENILHSEGYFYCQKYRIRMHRDHCPIDADLCAGCPELGESQAPSSQVTAPCFWPRQHGKISQEGVPDGYKRCNTCGRVKRRSEFYKANRQSDGIRGECKDCTRERNRGYWLSHKKARPPRPKIGPYRRRNV